MTTFLRKHSTVILISLLFVFLVLAWLFPSAGLMLGILFLLFSFVIASFAVLQKHNQAYRQGKITRKDFIRNALLEITGIGLAMILAGLLGRYIAELATEHIRNDLTKFIAAIILGVLTGIGVGTLVRQMWGRVVKTSPES